MSLRALKRSIWKEFNMSRREYIRQECSTIGFDKSNEHQILEYKPSMLVRKRGTDVKFNKFQHEILPNLEIIK